jgi:hypothetical protein
MPPKTKRARHSQSNQSRKKAKQRELDKWCNRLQIFIDNEDSLKNKQGKTRTIEEHCLILLQFVDVLQTMVNNKEEQITWTKIEAEVSQKCRCGKELANRLRTYFFSSQGKVLEVETSGRGGASETFDRDKHASIKSVDLLRIAKFVDDTHGKGASVTNKKICSFLKDKHDLTVTPNSVQRAMRLLGLNWKPTKPRARTLGAFRLEDIRKYLIQLDRYVKEIESGNPNNYVFVFTDESYVHDTHCQHNSYFADNSDGRINKSSSKGRRLIILHAITRDGPLCERDTDGRPVDDLKWKGDTPHPKKEEERQPGDPYTCETLWLATSNSGDYHANMDSDNFMKWASNWLLPTFKKLYPGKKMVLICDNAPYHHKRDIGSMNSKTKNSLSK